MQIVTRLNKVIAYSEHGYVPVGNSAICAVTKECFDDATIVTVDCVPTDIDFYNYYYINGKFVKEDSNSIIREANKREKMQLWIGTKEEYMALTGEDKENLFAIITNDTTKEGIIQAITDLQSDLKKLENGSFVVGKANKVIIHEINNETDLYNLATEYPNSSFAIYVLNDINIDTDTDYFTIPYGSHGYLWTEASGAYYVMFFDNQYINIYTVRRSASGNIERRDWESEWILERFKAPEATENDRLQGSGYYIINYMFNTEINSPVYSTGVFYWNGERELRLPTINQYIADDIPHCPIILKDGRFQLERLNEVGSYETLYPTETYIRKVW